MNNNVIFVLILGAFTAGCNTTPQRNFTGQPYSTSFATVRTGSSHHSSSIHIYKLDGYNTARYGRREPIVVDINPGYHTLCLRARNIDNTGKYLGKLSFRAEQGYMYEITLDPLPDKPEVNSDQHETTFPSSGSIYDRVYSRKYSVSAVSNQFCFVLRDNANNVIAESDAAIFEIDPPIYVPPYIPPPTYYNNYTPPPPNISPPAYIPPPVSSPGMQRVNF